MTPTARSLALLRRSGFTADVVERWLRIPGKNVRRDLFGFADLLAVHPGDRVFLLVQCTGDTGGNVAARVKKATGRRELLDWLRAGGRFEVWGWSRRGKHWHV